MFIQAMEICYIQNENIVITRRRSAKDFRIRTIYRTRILL